MGLPRYLVKKMEAHVQGLPRGRLLLEALCSGADYNSLVFEVLNTPKADGKCPPWRHVLSCFIRARWAFIEFRQLRKTCTDSMTLVPAKLYVGLEQLPSGMLTVELRSVAVPIYFLEKLRKSNLEREARDRSEAKLAAEINILRNKVYSSRCFPSRLRLIILERDKYCCQLCLRDRETLRKLGRHLDVDHVLAFLDGGKTTYSNGMTLCNECNIAKHHAKGYLKAIVQLGGGLGS